MAVVHRRSPLGKREGWVKDLSVKDRRALTSRNRSVAVSRATRKTKSFVEDNGPLIVVGVIAVLALYFRKELKEKIGGEPLQLNP